MVEEIKYVMRIFAPVWLDCLQHWKEPIRRVFGPQVTSRPTINSQQVQQIRYQVESTELLISIFFNLISVVTNNFGKSLCQKLSWICHLNGRVIKTFMHFTIR